MKYFVKFCEDKFNVAKECKTFKISPLSICKTMEGNRGDVKEGMIEHGITPGTIYRDKFDLGNGNAMIPKEGGFIYVSPQGQASTEYNFNCYVYCLAYLDESVITTEYGKKQFGEDVEGFFLINENDIAEFANYLAGLLAKSLTIEDFNSASQEIINRDLLNKQLSINYIHKPVEYIDKKFSHAGPNFDLNQVIDKLVFQKEVKYAEDNEFRIAFIPQWGQATLMCNDNNKIFKIHPNLFHSSF